MDIFNQLKQLRTNAYAQYSNYKVACIIIDENNQLFSGVNVENAVYPLCICAEQAATSNLITNGSHKIKEVHLLCSNGSSFGVPCGACRQVLSEFMDEDNYLYLYNDDGQIKKYMLKELLPVAFGNKFLKGDFYE